MQRNSFLARLNEWLQPELVNDYCPNGLQVEGASTIQKIVTGVTASQALIDAAIAAKADTILVHHGYFWKGEAEPIVGMKGKRIRSLIENNINLIAYHLPLDIHPEFGNNAQLLQLLNIHSSSAIDLPPNGILQLGEFAEPITGTALAQRIEQQLQRPLVASVHSDSKINSVAVCTGGGQGFIEQALAAGADAFITGEVSEQTIHVARECGIQFFAAGHHATERYGVRALGERIAEQLGIAVEFVDIDNPA
ncbi:MAG: Nif3-like dinuclear metal center hexameric protein [Idiomarina sp.]|nr:Nif3-like dinuclear metal center hexameric protein [Idiomarina sp.]